MRGINHTTGKHLGGLDHLRQSIADILTTPIGTRLMRRDYGSLLFELIDQPHNGITQLRLYAATATALLRWEPRLKLTQVNIYRTDVPGRVLLELKGKLVQSQQSDQINLSIPLTVTGAA
ncbi:GPW/gp25 family protein [Undibacterium rugosum]|uniref:GPW/gp25 family protein n=1 Tax=Undibacterium rugosum TaxID=2762291 RepID=UPI001B811C46|nr:GPW/gp25 family protein [Undibacterium rugosum]MBR7777372.1 GPW/gp25 family protein [Undibacterium rugosum]